MRLHTKDLPVNITSCALRGLSDGRLRLSDSPQQQHAAARPPAAPRVRTIATRPRHACSIARSLWGREDYCDARAAGVFNSPQPTNSCGPSRAAPLCIGRPRHSLRTCLEAKRGRPDEGRASGNRESYRRLRRFIQLRTAGGGIRLCRTFLSGSALIGTKCWQ